MANSAKSSTARAPRKLDPYAQQRQTLSRCRFTYHADGHYESYFLRANHPSRPLAFWIRYTIFAPKGNPQGNMGELWVIAFDGETHQINAVKTQLPLDECQFDEGGLSVRIGNSTLYPGALQGEAKQGANHIRWQLQYSTQQAPLLLLPPALYDAPLPKAKALVTGPNAVFSGHLIVNGETLRVDQWIGSENHNWGSKHTDEYAWGQVAGFDNALDAFLEVASARLKIGPVWTPRMTTLVLRVDGQEYAFNQLWRSVRATAHYGYFNWHFETGNRQVRIVGDIQAPRAHFVGLRYDNPPGGSHTCLNCKIARCRLLVQSKGHPVRELITDSRAAFEILTDDSGHGVPIVA